MTPDTEMVRVVTPSHERASSRLSPYGPGYEMELLQAFLDESGRSAAYLRTDDPEEARLALAEGEADLMVGFAMDPPQGGNATVVVGPVYGTIRPVVVTRQEDGEQDRDPSLAAASCADPELEAMLENQTGELSGMDDVQSCETSFLPAVLGGIDSRSLEFAVVDGERFRLWQPFFDRVRLEEEGREEIPLRWMWRTDRPDLAQEIQAFWDRPETVQLTDELEERYFGFLPNVADYQELEHISLTVRTDVEQYEDVIAREAEANGLDPLFLAAVIYQESRFRANARSHTGVRGLMQLTTATANMLGVTDRSDPEQSIKGGSAYLRMIWDDLEGLDLDPWDRWCFTLAAYNQGPGNLNRAMRIASRHTDGPLTWADMRDAYKQLSSLGGCRGNEAVNYVDSVRYYYYILHGFVALARPEAQHLASLF